MEYRAQGLKGGWQVQCVDRQQTTNCWEHLEDHPISLRGFANMFIVSFFLGGDELLGYVVDNPWLDMVSKSPRPGVVVIPLPNDLKFKWLINGGDPIYLRYLG